MRHSSPGARLSYRNLPSRTSSCRSCVGCWRVPESLAPAFISPCADREPNLRFTVNGHRIRTTTSTDYEDGGCGDVKDGVRVKGIVGTDGVLRPSRWTSDGQPYSPPRCRWRWHHGVTLSRGVRHALTAAGLTTAVTSPTVRLAYRSARPASCPAFTGGLVTVSTRRSSTIRSVANRSSSLRSRSRLRLRARSIACGRGTAARPTSVRSTSR